MEFYIWMIYERASELYVRVKIKNLRLTISTRNIWKYKEYRGRCNSKKKRRDRIFEFQFRERERITAENRAEERRVSKDSVEQEEERKCREHRERRNADCRYSAQRPIRVRARDLWLHERRKWKDFVREVLLATR